MMSKFRSGLPVIALVLAFSSCKKDIVTGNLNTGNFPADATPLKSAADFPVGVAINYTPFITETKFSDIVKADFDQVVCGYEMKHGAIVQSNGNLDFTQADAMISAAGNMEVFGHTLGWHQNQNATWLKSYAGIPSGTQIPAKVDQALNDFITNTVNHFKNKVKAWDVINEAVSPSGAFRTTANSSDIANKTASDYFMWSDYLGRDYALKAFTYAKAADPNAEFYINDYGLESSAVKTDSLIALVAELKSKGAKIDGIGTQMHSNINTSYALIDNMFKKLAATGLKIRVSELDVRLNPLNKPEYQTLKLPATLLATQADMYKYIVSSYMKYVPASQRAGITIWGVNDKNSWLYNSGKEYPLLFDNDYNMKPAYSGVLQGLKGQ